MDKYFDFHFHPLAKHHLAPKPKDPSYDDYGHLTRPVPMSKAFMDYTDETILRTLESQCCLDYLNDAKVRFGVATIAALEFGVASSKGFFNDILKNNLKKPFEARYFEKVKEGEVSYLNLFLRELEEYSNLEKSDRANFLSRENMHAINEERLNLTLAIEGGHNLCMKKIGNALEYDESADFKKSGFFDSNGLNSNNPADVLEVLVKKIRDRGWEVLYLTLARLTHIPEQHLATHAFGTKTMKHPSFYPFGNGLTELGKEVVARASELQIKPSQGAKGSSSSIKMGDDEGIVQSAPVFIDIAHMSLKSRLDLYDYRRQEGYTKIPLVASHVGVTGYSINDWKDNLDSKKCVNHVDQGIKTIKIYTKPKVAGYWGANVKKEFAFNPSTINLMDEDIIEVVRSGGMVGISLNLDMLGLDPKHKVEDGSYEFISTADFIYHFPYTSIKSLDYASTDEIRAEETWSSESRRELHPLSICFNIVHIMAVILLRTKEDEPENYICIGSDFDGFIEPLKICGDSRFLKDLEASLMKWLPVAATKYQKENGGAKDLFKLTKERGVLKVIVRKILYQNGFDFLERHYSRIRSVEREPLAT